MDEEHFDVWGIVLPVLGLIFAAFCIWLGVRLVNRREQWAKWTLATVAGLPLLYVASFGPACWASSHAEFGAGAVTVVYRPLAGVGPPVGWYLIRYSGLYARDYWAWWKNESLGKKDWEWEDYSRPEYTEIHRRTKKLEASTPIPAPSP